MHCRIKFCSASDDAYRSFLHVHAASSRKECEQLTPFLVLYLHFLSSIKAAWHGANALKIPSKISFFSRRDGSGSPVTALLRD
jgi:hypothetical protein